MSASVIIVCALSLSPLSLLSSLPPFFPLSLSPSLQVILKLKLGLCYKTNLSSYLFSNSTTTLSNMDPLAPLCIFYSSHVNITLCILPWVGMRDYCVGCGRRSHMYIFRFLVYIDHLQSLQLITTIMFTATCTYLICTPSLQSGQKISL